MGHIEDLPIDVSVELGRRHATLGELATLRPGAVVLIDRAADDVADVRAGGRLVARGRVVAVGEHFGIQVTDLVARSPRSPAAHKLPRAAWQRLRR